MNGQLAEVRFAVLRALARGATSVAVMASRNEDVSRCRGYLCRNGLSPTHLGINHAFDELADLIEDLPSLTAAHTAARVVEVLAGLAPDIQHSVTQAQARLGPAGTRKAGSSVTARALLEAADYGYNLGAAGLFPGISAGLAALKGLGKHIPAQDVARLYVSAARAPDLATQIADFQAALTAASHHAARRDHGILTMTIHASKGREFDHVVIFDATRASFDPANEQRRRLLYVAVTRARTGWDIIAPRGLETPLLAILG